MMGWEGGLEVYLWQAAEKRGDWRTLLQHAAQPSAN